MVEHVVKVVEHPLPGELIKSALYQQLTEVAQRAVVGHIRYVQEIPHKMHEWLANGSLVSELEALVERIDLDLMINLAPSSGNQDSFSPWIVQVSWVTHDRPLTAFLKEGCVSKLNETVPAIGADLASIRKWMGTTRVALQELLDDFFACTTYDHAVAHLVAIHTCLTGLKFGLGRIRIQYPS